MAGKRQKHPDALVFRRGGRVQALTVPPPGIAPASAAPHRIPDAPPEIGDVAREAWMGFWCSPMGQLVSMDTHGTAITHWIRCVDKREQVWALWAASPPVVRRRDARVTNPLWRVFRELSEMIAKSEDQFGMTPLAQMRLGVEWATGAALAGSVRASGIQAGDHYDDGASSTMEGTA